MTRSLPQDPLFPQLATALDESAMLERFTGWSRGSLAECRIDRIKYRPRRNLAVSYRLRGVDAGGRAFEQPVATRWCHGGEAARRHAKALARPVRSSAAGPGLTHDAGLDMVAHWWPNDAKLGVAAAALAEAGQLGERWLPEVARGLGRDGIELAGHDQHLVQLVPEHRVTARVVLRWADGRCDTVYAKADAETRGPMTHAVLQALARCPAQRAGELVTPQPLLWQPGSTLHWQRALPGRPLMDLAPQVRPGHAARAGALVAALHESGAPAPTTLTLEQLRQAPLDVARTLSLVEPGLAEPVQRLAADLSRRVSELAVSPMVTLHGDLHPRNLLIADDGKLGLIDFDSVRRGPLVLDLGSWVADTLYRAQIGGQRTSAAVAACRAFVEAHAAAVGHRVAESLLAWASAYQLLCQRVWRCLVNLKPGRYEAIGALLALARRLLDHAHVDAAADSAVAA